MKQQINLYKVEKREVDTRINFEQVRMGFWVCFGFLFLMTTHNLYGFIMDKADLYKLEQVQLAQKKDLGSMMDLVEKQKASDKIIAELQSYHDKNTDKEALLKNLSLSENAKIIAYSNYLESLAKKTIPGLWVDKLIVKDSGNYLFLVGECLSPELVTQFIAGLSSEVAFSGKTFAVFAMSMDEKTKKFTFGVETKRAAL